MTTFKCQFSSVTTGLGVLSFPASTTHVSAVRRPQLVVCSDALGLSSAHTQRGRPLQRWACARRVSTVCQTAEGHRSVGNKGRCLSPNSVNTSGGIFHPPAHVASTRNLGFWRQKIVQTRSAAPRSSHTCVGNSGRLVSSTTKRTVCLHVMWAVFVAAVAGT